MIHTLLSLTRPLFVVDTETTGLDPKVDRIVEIGFEMWTSDGMVREYRTLVNPEVPIPPETTAKHHITDADVRNCRTCGADHLQDASTPVTCANPKIWPTFRQLAPSLAKGFVDCDFAGKNVRFDLRFFACEFDRAGVEWAYMGARIIDADRLEQIGDPRTLSHLYRKHTGKEPVDAHQALADVKMTTEVLIEQFQKYQVLPRNLDALHELQWPGWIDPEGKFRFIDSVPCFGNWGKYANKPMYRADPGYWNWVLREGFSSDVKKLAEAAKRGEFPKEHT